MRLHRPNRRLASLVLAWFLLALGAAVLSPAFGAGSLELVCSGGSLKLAPQGDQHDAPLAGHVAHCPVCVAVGAPPPVVAGFVVATVETADPIPVAQQALAPEPPPAAWNARAPPSIS